MTVPAHPKPSLSFRPAKPADIPLLLPLIRSAYRGEASRKGWTTEADLVADQRIDDAGLLAKISEPEGVVLMVTEEDDGTPPITTTTTTTNTNVATSKKPLACCEILCRRLRQSADGKATATAYFGLFAVDPRRQAGGVGRRVLGYAEEFAMREWGCGRMEMCVIWTREELIAWYERRGYRRTGERREFPYAELVGGAALRDDLYFVVLEKELVVGSGL